MADLSLDRAWAFSLWGSHDHYLDDSRSRLDWALDPRGRFSCDFYVIFGWFKDQIREEAEGLHSDQLDRSYRQGMLWFIFSEVMFFAAFFGALFYVRTFSVPWIGGEGAKGVTNMLWEGFQRDVAFITDARYETVPRR